MKKQRAPKNMLGNVMRTSITNLAGIGMISATAGMVQGLPAGSMERNVAGIVPGLQSVA
jgi:hypothetical protein